MSELVSEPFFILFDKYVVLQAYNLLLSDIVLDTINIII